MVALGQASLSVIFSTVSIVVLVFDTHSFICHRRHKIAASVSIKTHNSAVLVSFSHLIFMFEEITLEKTSYDSIRHFPANTKSITAPHSSIVVRWSRPGSHYIFGLSAPGFRSLTWHSNWHRKRKLVDLYNKLFQVNFLLQSFNIQARDHSKSSSTLLKLTCP